MINEHVTEWLGYPVKDFTEDMATQELTDGASVIYRLRRDWDSTISLAELFAGFISNESVKEAPGIIIGAWGGDVSDAPSEEAVQLVAGASGWLTKLKGIFIGDILSEENEISWIQQSDVSPLLAAYPNLEALRVRGSSELSLGAGIRHEHLKALTIEAGGLPVEVLREALALDLPALEDLELWLGTEDYNGDATVADLVPLLSGVLFPKLKRLALRDSYIVDEIAAALQSAPVLNRISALDLSLGALTDKGAEHLLQNPALKKLASLDLHHHYCSPEMMSRLESSFPGVNLEDEQELDDGEAYVAVSE